MSHREKDRDISILDYFNVLQQEYLYFEVKSKIYPSSSDKDYFKRVMYFKQKKIEDIAQKNNLDSMFDSDKKLQEVRDEFFNVSGNPTRLGKRDWYFYYKPGSDFSYNGKGVKMVSYDMDNNSAVVKTEQGEIEVSLDDISRIL